MELLRGRLKERKPVQWALAYLAGAWVLLRSEPRLTQDAELRNGSRGTL